LFEVSFVLCGLPDYFFLSLSNHEIVLGVFGPLDPGVIVSVSLKKLLILFIYLVELVASVSQRLHFQSVEVRSALLVLERIENLVGFSRVL
jgi:hypothetical protein